LKEKKEYLEALDGMSAHHCQNAFFDISFGHNPFGIMLAMPSDMMHLYKSGILKQVCQSFTDSMSTNVRVGIDNLMEDISVNLELPSKAWSISRKGNGTSS
jgi:hypothetical protein